MLRPSALATIYRFGWFEADLAAGNLRRKGRLVALQEQPLQILRLLIANAGELVSRERLRQELWPPDAAVDFDRSLNSAMNKLRSALKDPARNSQFIQNVHGRGYRFIAPVSRLETRQPDDPLRKRQITGLHLWNRRDPEALQQALRAFQEMVDDEPASARGYSGMALCWCMLGDYGWAPADDAFPRAKEAALRAIELDAKDAEAHAALGFILHRREWNWVEAEEEYRRAVELDLHCATAQHWYAEFLSQRGRHDEAIARIAAARQLDPLSAIISIVEAWIYFHARRFDEADACVQRAMQLRENFAIGHYLLGRIRLAQGDADEAVTCAAKAVEAQPESAFILAQLGVAYARNGSTAVADGLLEKLRGGANASEFSPFLAAKILASLGQESRAFEALERGIEIHSSWMLDLHVDPELDTLRRDARWRALAERLDRRGDGQPHETPRAAPVVEL
ncbi:MAG TPA: winged helix-turn-helix domain-containing protein [Candidatus Krumholzibacteria bacterium]|jgi:DNA-binding winged helix-turn-helix (wHTH) protein/Tfp pilus assembly protein PilF